MSTSPCFGDVLVFAAPRLLLVIEGVYVEEVAAVESVELLDEEVLIASAVESLSQQKAMLVSCRGKT